MREINDQIWLDEKIVSHYAHPSRLQPPEIAIFEQYRNWIAGKKILDIGCGGGRTSEALLPVAGEYTGLDFSQAMIDICKKNFKSGQFVQADARDMKIFKDENFDFILFSYNGIDYMEHSDRMQTFREINRVLHPQGLFVFSSHNRNYKDATISPRLFFSKNPFTLFKNTARYFKESYRHSLLSKRQIFNEDYAVINDEAHEYRLLTYYVSKRKQREQLALTGFEILEMRDVRGGIVTECDDDKDSAWIYYVAKKVSEKS